jgi:hypothetical protein
MSGRLQPDESQPDPIRHSSRPACRNQSFNRAAMPQDHLFSQAVKPKTDFQRT